MCDDARVRGVNVTAKPPVVLTPLASLVLQTAHNYLVSHGLQPSHENVAAHLAEYSAGLLTQIEDAYTAHGFNRGNGSAAGSSSETR